MSHLARLVRLPGMPTTTCPADRPTPPDRARRLATAGRAAATALTASAAAVGTWALAAPASFYRGFPLTGHRWVAALGAYDEHLVRDVGALYLALGVLSAWAALRPGVETARLAGTAWLVFAVPHLLFHLGHLAAFDLADAAGNVLALGGTVALAAVLVTAPGRVLEGGAR